MAVLDTAVHAFFAIGWALKQGVDHPVKPGDDGVGKSVAKAPGITD
jgi:hypothetical protein